VLLRYILFAWRHRRSTDERSYGGLFYLLSDEVGTLDWTHALQPLEYDPRSRLKSRQEAFCLDSPSTRALDCSFAQLSQSLSADFKLRKLVAE